MPGSIRIPNIIAAQKAIQKEFSAIASSSNRNFASISFVFDELLAIVEKVETICLRRKIRITDLAQNVIKAYAWSKFLTEPNYLKLHVETVIIAQQLASSLLAPLRNQVTVEVANLRGLAKCKRNRNHNGYFIQLNEAFIVADRSTIKAIISNVLIGKNKINREIVRRFEHSPECQEIFLELDAIADPTPDRASGEFYDLEEIFNRVNRDYFELRLDRPRLSWSKKINRRTWGFYERARDKVVINQRLDRADVPRYAIELVVYHELLHKFLGVNWVNGRARVHTPEFRDKERQYEEYDRAEAWLNTGVILI